MMASNKNKLYLLKDTVVANENVALTRNETIDNQMNGILNSKFLVLVQLKLAILMV